MKRLVSRSGCSGAALDGVGDVVGHRRRSQHEARRHRVGDVRRPRRRVSPRRAGRRRARQGRGGVSGERRYTRGHPNQMLVFAELQKGTDPAKIIELLTADPAFQSRQFGILDLQGRSAGHSGLTNGYVSQDIQGQRAGHADLLLDPGQHSSPRRSRAERGEGVPRDEGRAHRSRDGRDGSRRRVGRRQPLHVPAAAGRRIGAGDSLRRQDGAHRVHPHGRSDATRTASRTTTGKYAMYLTVTQPGPDKGPNAIKAARISIR